MIYTIPKGKHQNKFSLDQLWLGWNVRRLEFNSYFLTKPISTLKGEDSEDVNKLFGISFGDHRKNSVRIGWRYIGNDYVKYYYYLYNKGVRTVIPSIAARFDTVCGFEINIFRMQNIILISETIKDFDTIHNKLSFDFDDVPKWSYKLYPYYGGNNVSETEIKIEIWQ